jgi:hypothetical protein
MNIIRCLALVGLFLSKQMVVAQINTSNIVGRVDRAFAAGDNLFATPLETGTGDTLTELFTHFVPDGTTISLWNPTTRTFDTTSTFSSGSWSINLSLPPGTGAELHTATSFTNSFFGYVLNHDGSALGSSSQLTPPPVYSGPNGVLLLGDKALAVDTGTDIFLNLLGRAPNPGEQVTTLDSATQTYLTSTYLGNGSWDTAPPTLHVGDAAFLNVGPVPEPSTLSLVGLGSAIGIAFNRRKSN